MFWKRIFLNRMMEYQVKFCHHSGPRLWRTRMLLTTKSKGHKSNVRISWMYRHCFYDLKVHFWWPNKRLKCHISSWHTLYNSTYKEVKQKVQIRIWEYKKKVFQTSQLGSWGTFLIAKVTLTVLRIALISQEPSSRWLLCIRASLL